MSPAELMATHLQRQLRLVLLQSTWAQLQPCCSAKSAAESRAQPGCSVAVAPVLRCTQLKQRCLAAVLLLQLPVAPLPATICVEVVRACGLLAAVDEAALWLGGGEAKARAACLPCSKWLVGISTTALVVPSVQCA